MKKITMEIDLLYDDERVHGDQTEAIEWFYDDVLFGEEEELVLHSNLIGDELGTVKVIKIIGGNLLADPK